MFTAFRAHCSSTWSWWNICLGQYSFYRFTLKFLQMSIRFLLLNTYYCTKAYLVLPFPTDFFAMVDWKCTTRLWCSLGTSIIIIVQSVQCFCTRHALLDTKCIHLGTKIYSYRLWCLCLYKAEFSICISRLSTKRSKLSRSLFQTHPYVKNLFKVPKIINSFGHQMLIQINFNFSSICDELHSTTHLKTKWEKMNFIRVS